MIICYRWIQSTTKRVNTMKIIDAEPQLLRDIEEEMEIITSRKTKARNIYAGIHPTLGRVVLIIDKDKSGAIVEIE